MKIGIVSDLHLGYSRWPEDAYKQAREALLKAVEMSDVVIMPGDIFDKENPSIDVISQMLHILLEIESTEWGKNIKTYDDKGNQLSNRLPIAVIHGTHERVEKKKIGPVKFIDLTKYWVDINNKSVIFEKNGEKVRIFGMGGVPEDLAKETLKNINPRPKPEMFNIFVLHQTFNELIPIKKEEYLTLNDLPKGFDLYINGHIHKYTIKMNGKFIIPGSTVITQLKSDEQEAKGFVIYDTSTKTHEFVKINSRPFVMKTLTFEETQPDEIMKKINNVIDEIVKEYPMPIIRIVLEGTLPKGLKPSDLTFNIDNPKAFKIYIDNMFEGHTIESTIERVKNIKRENKDPKKIGFVMLTEKLSSINFPFNVEELFDHLAESPDKGLEYIENVKLKMNEPPEE